MSCLHELVQRFLNVLLVCADLLVRLSLLTMTNPNQLCDVLLFVCSKMADETSDVLLFVCSKMADETNLSSKLPVADRTREV